MGSRCKLSSLLSSSSRKDYNAKVGVLEAQYCVGRQAGGGRTAVRTVPALFDRAELESEKGSFYTIMCNTMAVVQARHAAAVDAAGKPSDYTGPPLMSMLFQILNNSAITAAQVPNFLRLGLVPLVLATGGVEDERTFSTLKFTKNDLRNRLDEQHLNVCVALHAAKQRYTITSFPYQRAFDVWQAICQRRAVSVHQY